MGGEDSDKNENGEVGFLKYWNTEKNLLKYKYDLYFYHYPSYKHVTYNAITLKELIEKTDSLKNKKIVIIAHSMGGLVARSLIEEHGYKNAITLITLATPHHGSPGPLKNWVDTEILSRVFVNASTPGGNDLFWDNYDGVFEWAYHDMRNGDGRLKEVEKFDQYYNKLLSDSGLLKDREGIDKINDAYETVNGIVKRFANPWLTWLNENLRQYKTIINTKYILYGGFHDGINKSENNLIKDNWAIEQATSNVIYDKGYFNDSIVPVTSAFLDFSYHDNFINIGIYNPILFDNKYGKVIVYDRLIENDNYKDNYIYHLYIYKSFLPIYAIRFFKDYNHGQMKGDVPFDDFKDNSLMNYRAASPLNERGLEVEYPLFDTIRYDLDLIYETEKVIKIIPDAVSVNPSDTTWKDSPHSLDVSSKNAEKIYCKVSIKTDGSEPDDPEGDPSAKSHDAFNKNMDEFINGSSGKFEMYADPGQIKRIKVKFRGWNANGYGPTSQVYSYTIDLRQTESPKVTPPGAVSVSPKSSSDSWETSPQYVKLNCPNAEVIYCTVRLSKDGTAPKEDPPEPTVEAHDAFNENMDETVGPTGQFEVWGKAGEYKVIKVRFRGYHSKNGYGPSTTVYTYRLDLTDADSGDSSGKEKKPDIVVRDLYLTSEENESTPRTTFLLNQPIRIFTRVKNIGKADANKDIRIEYSLSPGTEISPNQQHVGKDDIKKENLKKGADKRENYHYSSDDPLPTTPGIYNITVRVDTGNDLDEENENNNEFNPPLVFEVIDPNAPPTDQLVSGIDTALIIDSSGSMSDNDPKNYRLEAARFFIDRAEDSDYIAVVDFDSGVYVDPEKGTFRIAKDNRSILKEAVSLIDAGGGTNIGAGLNTAYDQLGFGDPNTTKIAILLTDGDGTYNNEASLYQAKGWRIFTIGLGEGVNEVLLKKIAADTGGEYFKVTTEEAARNAITQIYQIISRSVHAGEQIVRQEQFKVSLGEVVEKEFDVPAGTTSLWVDRIIPGSDVELVLIQPDGKVIDRNTTDPNVYHSLGATYEIYRVNNPMPGKWKTKLIGIDTLPDGEPTTLSISINNPEAAARELKNSHEQTVYERSVVTLDGTKSAYSNKIITSYQWTMAGKAPDWIATPTLSNPNSPNPTFTAPEVGIDGGSMVFQLIVTDSSSRQSSDVYNVKILNIDSDLADDAEESGMCFISSAGNAPDKKGFWLLMGVFAVFVLIARKTQRNQRSERGMI